MFNPRPRISVLPLGAGAQGGDEVVVLDDVLLDPDALVALACRHRDAFAPATSNAFPGPELPLPESVIGAWTECFMLHACKALGVRRVREASGRLSIVTLAASRLGPLQRLCHRDRLGTVAGEMPAACVIYLFDNPLLGGTAFYRPRQGAAETETLMQRAAELDDDGFTREFSTPPGYLTGSNRWFEQTAVVPAAYNRAIFYRGDRFHTSHIERPDLLSDDPVQGRLTMNGFFVCRATLRSEFHRTDIDGARRSVRFD